MMQEIPEGRIRGPFRRGDYRSASGERLRPGKADRLHGQLDLLLRGALREAAAVRYFKIARAPTYSATDGHWQWQRWY